ATAGGGEQVAAALVEAFEPDAHLIGTFVYLTVEGVICPKMFDGGNGRDEGRVVPTEGSIVFARFPHIEIRAQQNECEGLTRAGQRLRQADDVRFEAHLLEGEEGAGAATTDLNVDDD